MIENELCLVIPTLEHKKDAMEYRQEWIDCEPGESIHGSGGLHRHENYEEWLKGIEKMRNNQLPEWVPGTTYFAVYNNNNNKIVGTIQIRYILNETLFKTGGHIGYGVRPSERRKGFATKMLALALDECKKLNIDRVLITCDKDNLGSARTIQKHGGVLENEIVDDDGEILQRYWIDIKI